MSDLEFTESEKEGIVEVVMMPNQASMVDRAIRPLGFYISPPIKDSDDPDDDKVFRIIGISPERLAAAEAVLAREEQEPTERSR